MRSFALVALLVAGGLAGCLQSHPAPPAPVPTAHGGAAPVVTPVVFHADGRVLPLSAYPGEIPVFAERYVANRGGGEPTVAVNAKGQAIFPTIAFDTAEGRLASTKVMATSDDGRNWTDASPGFGTPRTVPISPADPTSLDPYVYADPVTGRLFNVDLNLAAGGFLSWSDDGGATWTNNPGCCGLPVDDHQTLFAGPARTLPANPVLYPGRILYYCINQIASTSCTHSVDGGLTWSDPVSVFPGVQAQPDQQVPAGLCGGLAGHGHASEVTGTVFLPKGQCGVPTLGRSTDNGVTWSLVRLDADNGFSGHDGAVATDAKGNVYYFFIDGKGLPRLSVSKDDGVSWSMPMNVTAPGVTVAELPAVTAGADGHVAFLYVGSTNPAGRHVYDKGNETLLQNATWNVYVGTSLDALDADPVFATVTAHAAADPIRRGNCAGRCISSDGGGGLYDFLDLQVRPDTGQLWAAMVDECTSAATPANTAPVCNTPEGTYRSYQPAHAAVGVQVGGTLLGKQLPS
jgi:hypothetical protein